MLKLVSRISTLFILSLTLTSFTMDSSAQQATPVFTPGNLVVTVSGCATQGGTCTNIPSSGNASFINGPAGGYSDDQGSPWTLFQFSVTGATSATYVNSLQLPQLTSGANLPISNDYGSLSEGTLQLSGDGRFLSIAGYGLSANAFNANYLLYCPGSTVASNACVPSNGNPAMAQTGSLIGQTYVGNIPVPRVAALVDPYGNVNTSTELYNVYNQNDVRSASTVNGSTMYMSGQGCKTNSADGLCDGSATSPYDDTMGVYLTPFGVTNTAPTAITGPDNGPTGCTSLTTCTSSQDTRMVTVYGNTVYVSLDSAPGSSTGGYNRSYIGTLGTAGATSVFTCAGSGAGCPTGAGPYGPALMPGFGNTGGTGKYTLNTAGSGNTSNGNSLNAGLKVNLSPQNFFFASPTVLYVADTGFPKNNSNGPDAVCTSNGGKKSATVGDGGLQKWILNPTVTVTLASGSPTATATSGAFTQGEIGLPITGTGIPAGTTITAVSSAGANATLSVNATVSGSEGVTVSGWSLAYTLSNGLNLVLNSDCNPNSPIAPGTTATTGLYGVTGVVSGGVATLYVTSYPDNDLVNSYLYGITDTLTTTSVTAGGTTFTQLAAAPSDSVFRGLAMAPSLPNGSETITSMPSGLTFATSGSGCAAGTYITPFTLTWTPGSSCTLSVASTQTIGNTPTNPATTTYNFTKWQDGTTATTDTVTAPSTTGVYNIRFQTVPSATFPTASSITAGQTLASSTLSGGSAIVGLSGVSVPGTFAFTSPSTIPVAGKDLESVTFTPADSTDYTSVTGTVTVPVYGPPVGNLEQADDASTGSTTVSSTDSLFISGWAADPTDGSPLSKVQIYIDGNPIGAPMLGISRPDVASYYSNPAYANSGFQLTYPAGSLSVGTHIVKAVATNGGNLSTTLGSITINVTVVYASPIGNLETAVDQSTGATAIPSSDTLFVSGWIGDPADGSPMTNVKVYLDGVSIGTPTLGIARQDVANYYNNPAYANSGFNLSYAASLITPGSHMITVIGINSHSVSTTLGPKTITVTNAPVGNLETVVDAATGSSTISQSTSTIFIGGWAADYYDKGAAQQVQILIDGTESGLANLGGSRPDVATYYNEPTWNTSGFSFTESASGLSLGSHTATAIATDKENKTTTLGPITFTVSQ